MAYSEVATNFNQAALAPPAQSGGAKSGGTNWLSLIPSGLAAAASFIPGVGTLASGLIGAGGEVGRELLNNEGLDLGKIGTQGVLNAIPGGALVKGAEDVAKIAEPALSTAEKAVTTGGGLIGKVESAAPAVATQATNTGNKVGNFLENLGVDTKATAGGYSAGTKVAGQNPLSINGQNQLDQFLKTEGIKTGSPTARLSQVESAIQDKGNQIGQVLETNNRPLTPLEKSNITNDFLQSMNKVGTMPADHEAAQQLVDSFNGLINDTKGVTNAKQDLQAKIASFSKNPAATAPEQFAANQFQRVLQQHEANLTPGLSDLNKSYSGLQQAKDLMTKNLGSAKPDLPLGLSKVPIVGEALTGAARGVESKAGGLIQGAGKIVNSPAVGLTANIAGKTVPPVISTATSAEGTPTDQSQTNGPSSAADIVDKVLKDNGVDNTQSGAAGNGMPDTDTMRQALSIAMMQALQKGDTKGVATIKTVMDTIAPASSSSTLTTQQKNGLVSEQKALDVIKSYAGLLDQAGGGQGPIAGTAEGLLGKVGLGGQQAANVAALSQQKADLTSAVASALSATGRANVVTLKQLEDSVPTVTDPPAVLRAKMSFLVNLMTAGTGANTTSLPDISSGLGGPSVPNNTVTTNIGNAMAGG